MNTDTKILVKDLRPGNARYIELRALIGLRRGNTPLSNKVGVDLNAPTTFGRVGSYTVILTIQLEGAFVRLSQDELKSLHAGSNDARSYLQARVVLVG